MRILIVKTSSLGDVIHTFPALVDAKKAIPELEIDWVVEENYAALVKAHPLVRRIVPMAWRRWRKKLLNSSTRKELKLFYKNLRSESYHYVIDAQGLLKSTAITLLSQGLRCGYDRQSIRQGIAALGYQKHFTVSKKIHAITRIRNLFSQVLQYDFVQEQIDFGFEHALLKQLEFSLPISQQNKYLVFFPGTTWENKHWPEVYWAKLLQLISTTNYRVLIAWGSAAEKERALRLKNYALNAELMPPANVVDVMKILTGASGVVAVDTGFAHLASALNIPAIILFGPTSPDLTGPINKLQKALAADFSCAPCFKKQCFYKGASEVKPACFATLKPEKVWEELKKLMHDVVQ